MNWFTMPITAPLLIGAALLILLACWNWLHREQQGALALSWLALSVSVWTITYALEWNANDVAAKTLWSKLQFVGVASAPLAWLVFAVTYAARSGWFTLRRIAALLVLPLITLLLVFTNERHGLIWSDIVPRRAGAMLVLEFHYGTWFWISTTYSYLAMLVGTLLLARMALYAHAMYRRQASLLMISALAPWVGQALGVFQIGQPGRVDLTPFAYGASVVALEWLLFRYQLLALVPLAHTAILSAMRSAIFVLDTDCRVVALNPMAEQLVGLPSRAARGALLDGLLPSRPPPSELCASSEERRAEVVIEQPEAARIYDAHMAPLHDLGGRINGRLVILNDISELKIAEATQRFLAKAGSVLGASLDYEVTLARVADIAVPDLADCCIVQLAGQMLGADHTAVACADLDHQVLAAALQRHNWLASQQEHSVIRVLRTGRPELVAEPEAIQRELCGDDEDCLTAVKALGLRALVLVPLVARGRTIGVMLLGASGRTRYMPSDVVLAEELAQRAALAIDNARLFAELRASEEAAGAATRAKSAFLANMSHEIRTPMNGVIGAADLLVRSELDSKQRALLDIIQRSGRSLLHLINDILDLSKIESGKLDLVEEPFDLRECIEEALDLIAIKAAEKGLDLAYHIDAATPSVVIGDRARLQQVLLNLLSNAVKFTDVGSIVVAVDIRHRAGQRYEYRFAVRDTGIGIAPEHVGQLFQTFSQLDATSTRNHGGAGLGLALSQRLCEMMGGQIWVESERGRGTTVLFTISAQGVAPAQHAEPPFLGRRLLLIDAPVPSRASISTLARQWGIEVRETDSEAKARRWLADGERFDLAIVGAHQRAPLRARSSLPTLLVHRDEDAQRLPLVLLMSLGQEVGLEPLKPSFEAALTRPVKADQLLAVLREQLDAPAVRTVRAPILSSSAADEPRSPLTVLVAEDDLTNQKLVALMLAKLGHPFEIVSNGVEAVAAVERGRYDVVLLDVQMPVMDGLAAARSICQIIAPERRPYLVALTASAIHGDRERCLRAGMDDYVSKPFDVATFEAVLERARAHLRAAPPPPLSDVRARHVSLRASLTGDEWAEVVQAYLDDTPAIVALLERAVDASDAVEIGRGAHRLKSCSAIIGAARLVELCNAIEHSAHAEDARDTEVGVQALVREWHTVVSALVSQA